MSDQKLKDIQFHITEDKEKQQIPVRQETETFWDILEEKCLIFMFDQIKSF